MKIVFFTNKFINNLKKSHAINYIVAYIIAGYLKFVYFSNKKSSQTKDPDLLFNQYGTSILTFWHGRHLMGPFFRPKKQRVFALFSKSKDADLNVYVAQRLGLEIIRGSGGRTGPTVLEKGGARALLALKNALKSGVNVSMIADIPHGVPKESGLGIIMLAKISGRPIIPVTLTFSREKILKKTWDQMSIPLPFGTCIFLYGAPIYVKKNSGPDILEEKRQELTACLNELMKLSYNLLNEKDGDVAGYSSIFN